MDRNEFVAVIFLFFIIPEVSNASFALQSRILAGLAPTDNSTTTLSSPGPNPVTIGNKSKNEPVNVDKPNKDDKSKDTEELNNSSKPDPKGSNNTGDVSPPTGKDKNHQKKEGNEDKNDTKTGTTESCDKLPNRCTDLKKMVACILESKELVLLVQNEGESTLKVNLTVPTSSEFASKELKIPKHQTEKINISPSISGTTKIVLSAGNEDCVLHVGSVSEGSFFSRLPSYSKVVTPIYGAFFLFLIALVVGGSWACCKFRKTRRVDGVPYQELEMGLPETSPTIDAETAEGWDQGWDDDWEEDKAVKSPGRQHVGNISGNGLTSRSSNRDGWEINWDD